MRSFCRFLSVWAVAALTLTVCWADQARVITLADQMNPAGTLEDPGLELIAIDCDAGDTLEGLPLGPVGPGFADGDDDDDDDGARLPLLVEISGRCTGNLIVERDNVTLMGIGQGTAGIEGASDDMGNPVGSVIEVRYSRNVRVHNLVIGNGFPAGIDSIHSEMLVGGCTLERSGRGFRSIGSDGAIRNSKVHGNFRGISTGIGDLTIVDSCMIHDNVDFGIFSTFHGNLAVAGTTEIRNNGRGIVALSGAQMEFLDETTHEGNGAAFVGDGSSLSFGGNVTSTDMLIHVENSSSLVIGQGATLPAAINLLQASDMVVNGTLLRGAQVRGASRAYVGHGAHADELICVVGGVANCEDTATVPSTDCAGCMVPDKTVAPATVWPKPDPETTAAIREILKDPRP